MKSNHCITKRQAELDAMGRRLAELRIQVDVQFARMATAPPMRARQLLAPALATPIHQRHHL